MGSRFVLIIVLARLLEPAEVGLFGLFTATIALSMLVIGGDYYTYSQRELISSPESSWSNIIQHQTIATMILYIILLPLQMLIFWLDLLPEKLILWFFLILVFEHIGQEINRLLIAMRYPLTASWVMFIRTALWISYVLPVMWFDSDRRDLLIVFESWLVGGVLAVLYGGLVIYLGAKPWYRINVNWDWLFKGFKVALMFILATASLKAITTFDRYFVEYFNDATVLGVYVLYIGMAMVVANLLEPAVYSFLYPRLISAYNQNDFKSYSKVMKEMIISALSISILLVCAIGVLAPFVFEWIGREVYQQYLPALWILLLASMIYGLSMIPHYGLYARGADKSLMFSHLSSLGVFIFVSFVSSNITVLLAVPIGLLATFTWIAVIKSVFYYRLGSLKIEKPEHSETKKGVFSL